VILVGGNFKTTHQSFPYFNTAEEAGTYIQQQQFLNTSFLIKGSRSMQMEKVLTAFDR
jgi:UDP-N-acetylmuramoyl-tripeptide--D-alanyl-D-alanine ligase